MGFKKFVELDEAAVLDTSNLGLYIIPSANLIGLYIHDENMKEGIENYDSEQMEESWLGSIDLVKNNEEQCIEVKSVFTRKNYGPLLYLICMEFSKHDDLKKSFGMSKIHKGLSATSEVGYVSDDALNIWNNFNDGKGSELVKSVPLKNPSHNEESLNKRYINVKSIDIKSLFSKGNSLVENDEYDEKKTLVDELFSLLLSNKMAEIYNN
jgi:hypothetical protein